MPWLISISKISITLASEGIGDSPPNGYRTYSRSYPYDIFDKECLLLLSALMEPCQKLRCPQAAFPPLRQDEAQSALATVWVN